MGKFVDYWVSCKSFTVVVRTDLDTGRVIGGAPITRKYIGQSVWKLFAENGVDRIGVMGSGEYPNLDKKTDKK